MRLLYVVILLFPLIIMFFLSYRRFHDYFSPLCIYSVFVALKYIPAILNKNYEAFTELNSDNTLIVTIMQLIAVISVVIGYLLGSRYFINHRSDDSVLNLSNERVGVSNTVELAHVSIVQWKILLVYFIGMIARVRIIILSGGISKILGNVSQAYAGLSNGTGFLSLLSNCVIISAMLQLSIALEALNSDNKQLYKKRMTILIIMVLLYSISYLVFSSRSPVFEIIMYLGFGYNYLYKRFKIRSVLKPSILILFVLCILILVLMPKLRTSSYTDPNRFDGLTGRYASDKNFINEVTDEFSVVGRDAYVYENFDYNNFWYGKSFKGLLTAFIPYSLYPQKPPVDDGLYLSNMIYGYSVNPPVARDQLVVKYSIPFTTPSSMYANFGVLGIVFGEFVVGFLYVWAYGNLRKHTNVFSIVLYQLIIYQFELTTLSIMQTLMPLIICFLIFYILTRGHFSKIRIKLHS